MDKPDSPPAGACEEYNRLSRRGFLAAGSATLAALAAPAWLPRVSFAKDYRSSQRDAIISIYLRGAADGLSIVVPYADNAYYAARPSISVPRPDSGQALRCTDLNGFFGFPPAMEPLRPAYLAGKLCLIQACGSVFATRSHFDAQRYMEVGRDDDPMVITGWLGRHIATVNPADPSAVLRAVSLTTGLARTLVGAPRALPIPNLSQFDLGGSGATRPFRRQALSDVYAGTVDPLRAAAATTTQTIDALHTISFTTYTPSGGAAYGTSALGLGLKSVAALLKARIGVEAVAIDMGGWDTHTNQGTLQGTFASNLSTLAQALGAFHTDMTTGPVQPGHIAVVMSEFGRRVAENGSLGCDHGRGNCMMVLGSSVVGGRVMGTWPGLDPAHLYEGMDLQVTTDYRDILSEICVRRLGATDTSAIFPGYTPTFRGVVA